ncbi:carbohydrate-binding module family 18 protein [Piromyces sp. E2]|nr:carbohydrate-binding module family 18 protein [Piromyces sp. E2]|eukprot:OUM66698.1 carbohydrate-binding module family 18 protein [Piromyces sp. E2]
MAKFINFYFIMSMVTLLFTSSNAKKFEKAKAEISDDKYYMVVINNDSTDKTHGKRQETQEFVNSMVDEIHNLIVGNKDSYSDIEKFEEIEENDSMLKKRSEEIKYLKDYGDSSYVYPIASNDEKTILYAYLSSDLKETIKDMPNVAAVNLPTQYEPDSVTDYENEIKEETKWSDIKINEKSPLHLSLISQGKFNKELIDEYDNTYYYPSSAGKDIDIFVFDAGFNFKHKEFKNKDERTTKCVVQVLENGKIIEPLNEEFCYSTKIHGIHGVEVATVAGGLNSGVANKANIYGVLIEDYTNANAIAGLEYVKNNLFRPGKAVFNFSFGGFTSYKNFTENEEYIYFQQLINEMSEEGAVFFSSAGNMGVNTYNETTTDIKDPCSFKNEICVGGIDSYDLDVLTKTDKYIKTRLSNFGKEVDLYAPYHARVEFQDQYGYDWTENIRGTSFSTPIAAGIAATIMSENPDVKFNSKSMLLYLQKISEKNVISGILEDYPNYFVNNGKRTVYSKNNTYHGCGIHAGNSKCGSNECCSVDGHCAASTDDVCKTSNGCQTSFGTCEVVRTQHKSKCGLGYGSCKEGYCCSAQGYCGQTNGHCGVGCQKDYGLCLF